VSSTPGSPGTWVTGIADVAQVVFVRKRLVEIQYFRSVISDEQREEFGHLVQDSIRRIEAAEFLPTLVSVFPRTPAPAAPTSGPVWDGQIRPNQRSCRAQEQTTLVGLTSLRTRIPPMLQG